MAYYEEKIFSRGDVIDFLMDYTRWLEHHNYIDSDWYTEPVEGKTTIGQYWEWHENECKRLFGKPGQPA